MNLIARLLPSVRLITAGITKAIAALEAVAAREQRAAEACLRQASEQVTKANAHRAEAQAARKVAKAISDLVS
ncbi:hypothetical protein [Variovorax paradoxus]|uniref:hypothetical protein n=1 Tax=Variovorax paradoxus TaxID=34073 RepID=UPI0028549864|nr:hypothetical protein [Variovorax paradoxus]MDR6455520.1 Tfp pilus assembly protein PilX [Variovorax paradoxus]